MPTVRHQGRALTDAFITKHLAGFPEAAISAATPTENAEAEMLESAGVMASVASRVILLIIINVLLCFLFCFTSCPQANRPMSIHSFIDVIFLSPSRTAGLMFSGVQRVSEILPNTTTDRPA